MQPFFRFSTCTVLAGLFLIIAPTQAKAQSNEAGYRLYAGLIPEKIMTVVAAICGPSRPTPQLLETNGYVISAEGVWEKGPIRVSFGDGLGSGAGHHCVVCALYPGGARPAGADKIFKDAMARTLAGRFGGDPDSVFKITKTPFNYNFSLTDIKTGDWQLDGVIIPPAPALGEEVGGIMLNMP